MGRKHYHIEEKTEDGSIIERHVYVKDVDDDEQTGGLFESKSTDSGTSCLEILGAVGAIILVVCAFGREFYCMLLYPGALLCMLFNQILSIDSPVMNGVLAILFTGLIIFGCYKLCLRSKTAEDIESGDVFFPYFLLVVGCVIVMSAISIFVRSFCPWQFATNVLTFGLWTSDMFDYR